MGGFVRHCHHCGHLVLQDSEFGGRAHHHLTLFQNGLIQHLWGSSSVCVTCVTNSDIHGQRLHPLTPSPKLITFLADDHFLMWIYCPLTKRVPLRTSHLTVPVSHWAPLLCPDQIANMAAPHLPTSPSLYLITFHFPWLWTGVFPSPQPYSPHPHCECSGKSSPLRRIIITI